MTVWLLSARTPGCIGSCQSPTKLFPNFNASPALKWGGRINSRGWGSSHSALLASSKELREFLCKLIFLGGFKYFTLLKEVSAQVENWSRTALGRGCFASLIRAANNLWTKQCHKSVRWWLVTQHWGCHLWRWINLEERRAGSKVLQSSS